MKITAILSLLPLLALGAPAINKNQISEVLKSQLYEGYEKLFSEGIGALEKEATSQSSIQARQFGSSTRNELESGRCANAIIIYARGTTESGNVGTVLSSPLFSAINLYTGGQAIFQGVNDYPADIAGYLAGGSRTGARNMAAQVSRAASQCPGDKVFLVGYSQGSQVTHLAGDLIPAAQRSVVAGIVVFGDPNNGDNFPGTLNNNVLTVCDVADPICYGIPLPVGAHLTYGSEAPAAARWIAARV